MRLLRQGIARLAIAALVCLLALAAPAPAAEPVFEKYKVPTVGGAEINAGRSRCAPGA